jgi:hypothetical protein
MLRTKQTVTLKPELTSKLIAWGSYEVVLAYAQLRMHLTSKEPSVAEIKEGLDRTAGSRSLAAAGHRERSPYQREMCA